MLVTDAFNRLSRAGLALAILPHESYWSLKAIIVTLWRLTISHRYLNEWKSASSLKPVEPDVRHFYRRMWINPVAGTVLVFLTSLSMPSMTHVALALALLWAVAPRVTEPHEPAQTRSARQPFSGTAPLFASHRA
ncbi:hypothetical protein [Pantoea sp. 1B4]|uniref:hypothetical protein n=1 Tax=Pantoea sp. 1B4 TaxID=2804760 RepID=UPI002D803613|nr:hypothetical protein [Pantoea sp. 1B4]